MNAVEIPKGMIAGGSARSENPPSRTDSEPYALRKSVSTTVSVHLNEPFGEVSDSMTAVPEADGLVECLTTIIGRVCRVGPGVVTVEDAVVDETFEDTFSWFV